MKLTIEIGCGDALERAAGHEGYGSAEEYAAGVLSAAVQRDDPGEGLSLEERGVKAAKRYLKLQGYEVIETGFECEAGTVDIVARDDDGTLCFVDVRTRKVSDASFDEIEHGCAEHERRERQALTWLASAGEDMVPDFFIRFDNIAIAVMESSRALLRHHKNVLGME